jgi:hypothetical protein
LVFLCPFVTNCPQFYHFMFLFFYFFIVLIMICVENIPVWQKIRQSIPQLI